jgi:hypothetical protein
MNMLKAALGAAALSAGLNSAFAEAQSRETFEILAPDGHTIAADLALPDGVSAAVPVVLLISGSGAQDREASLFDGRYAAHPAWRDAFIDSGVAVLTFDEAGQGESGGNWSEMGLHDMAAIGQRLIVRARNHAALDPDRVFVLGHSEGGMIASLISAQDDDLAGIVLVASPGRSLPDVLDYQLRLNAAEQTEDPAEREIVFENLRAQWMGMIEQNATLLEAFHMDPLALAAGIQSPVIILQGWSDWQIEPEQAWSLAQAIRETGGSVDLHMFADVNHLLIRDPAGETEYQNLTDFTLDAELLSTGVDWVLKATQ